MNQAFKFRVPEIQKEHLRKKKMKKVRTLLMNLTIIILTLKML